MPASATSTDKSHKPVGRQAAQAFDLNTIGPNFIAYPYPMLRALRRHSPIHQNLDGSLFLTRYEDVRKVYQDRSMSSDKRETFRGKFGDGPLYTHHTTSLVFNDPPYHTVVRKLLASAFTPRKLFEMEPMIEAIVDRLLERLKDEIRELGQADFVTSFAAKLPTEIISMMLGVPQEYRGKLRAFSLAILGALDPTVSDARLKAGNDAVTEFSDILECLIAERRRNPDKARQGEVLEALIFGEHEGRVLNPVELVQNCIFLLNAGHETTTSLVSNAAGIFLDHPQAFTHLVERPELIDTAIEEILRYESPLQIGNRLTTRETEIGGKRFSAGTYIHTSIASANRDETEFENGEVVDFSRKPNRHLAFITGIHVCLGATLARYEGRIALGKLAKRFPELKAAGPAERMPLARFRGYNSLPVTM